MQILAEDRTWYEKDSAQKIDMVDPEMKTGFFWGQNRGNRPKFYQKIRSKFSKPESNSNSNSYRSN